MCSKEMALQLTTKQQRVLTTLKQSNGPLSAYTLLDRLRDQGFSAPTQVYRALERLAEHGLVHRLETLNAYVSCHESAGCQDSLKAFAICDYCGRVDEFINGDLGQCLGRWMKGRAFSLSSSTIELHGRCAECASLSSDAGRP